jgi:cobalt/nickel transport protein
MSVRAFTLLALAVAVASATLASPQASRAPDGLSRVAEDQRFSSRAVTPALQERAPAAGYALPGIAHEGIATGAAGLMGTLIVFAALAAAASKVSRPGRGAGAPRRGRF